MQKNLIIKIISGIFILIIAYSSSYTISETEQVIITQFGRPVGGNAIREPGIHFKLPFIQKVNYFDKRFLEWNGDPEELTTLGKKLIFVDTYARWRIVNPLLFFQTVQNEAGAQTKLDDILDGATKSYIAKHFMPELVRTKNSKFKDLDLESEIGTAKDSLVGRLEIENGMLHVANQQASALGIEVLDLKIKRIIYTEKVLRTVYDRMISERKKISDLYISEGQGEALKINGDREREIREIRSSAFKETEEIRGKADATATKIYAEAYNKNVDTQELYRFLKTLETYKKTISKKDILILSTKSDLFRYLEKKTGN